MNKEKKIETEQAEESQEFKLKAFDLYKKIDGKIDAIEKAKANLKAAAKSTSDFCKETSKEIMEIRCQIASGAIQEDMFK